MRDKALDVQHPPRRSAPFWRRLPLMWRLRRHRPASAAPLAPAPARAEFEQRLHALLDDCRYGEAIAALNETLRETPLDPDFNDQLHALYQEVGDTVSVLAQGQQWLAARALAGRGKEALAAWRTLQKIDPGFIVQEGRAVLPLAQAAVKHGDQALAVQLLQGFDKRFPEHEDLPGVFFLGAQLMHDYGRRHDQAVTLLRRLLKRYPGHAVARDVRTYLGLLERMQVR
ncbi:tetratricopeptide repeat protein [Aquincola sp. S2]|uniref:Tetratricopeptide repeat protein n=1 Tax=Pseudaquabacterium terrae TaxID=2732868 RepID=A0ABX2ECT6_9BURK|nr:tetratricopeptide repeat protein [Aquabacterium terrae]NRF65657.1 tetratricopeptide repeat protein [Aquabacterium terrae]